MCLTLPEIPALEDMISFCRRPKNTSPDPSTNTSPVTHGEAKRTLTSQLATTVN